MRPATCRFISKSAYNFPGLLGEGQQLTRTRPAGEQPTRKVVSSRNVCCLALSSGASFSDITPRIARHFYEVQSLTRPTSHAINDFADFAILAYECGYSQEMMKVQLQDYVMSEAADSCLKGLDEEELLQNLGLVWLTLMLSPRTVKRWATGAAVTQETRDMWHGFVAMIVTAYYENRVAWYPPEKLALEMNLQGQPQELHDIAQRAQFVYATLDHIAPQFPRM